MHLAFMLKIGVRLLGVTLTQTEAALPLCDLLILLIY